MFPSFSIRTYVHTWRASLLSRADRHTKPVRLRSFSLHKHLFLAGPSPVLYGGYWPSSLILGYVVCNSVYMGTDFQQASGGLSSRSSSTKETFVELLSCGIVPFLSGLDVWVEATSRTPVFRVGSDFWPSLSTPTGRRTMIRISPSSDQFCVALFASFLYAIFFLVKSASWPFPASCGGGPSWRAERREGGVEDGYTSEAPVLPPVVVAFCISTERRRTGACIYLSLWQRVRSTDQVVSGPSST